MSAQTTPDKNAPSPVPARPPALTVIEPGQQSWSALFSGLYRHRELLYFLIWRDVTIRYKQTILGVLWVLLQPLVTMSIFFVVFSRMAKIPSDGLPYPLFVLAGIVPWGFFSDSLKRSSESLVNNSNLLTKVYFPRLILPCSSSLAAMADFLVALTAMAAIMAYYRAAPGIQILALPVLAAMLLLNSVSAGILAATVNVRWRDTKFVVAFLIQIWMFATPVVYPLSLVPEKYRTLALLNPLTGVVEGFRWSLLGRPFPGQALAVSAGFSLALFLSALAFFKRAERTFADVV